MGKPLREVWMESDFKAPIVLSLVAGVLIFVVGTAVEDGLVDISHLYLNAIPYWIGYSITIWSYLSLGAIIPVSLFSTPMTFARFAGPLAILFSLLSLFSSSVGGLFIGAALGVIAGIMIISKSRQLRSAAEPERGGISMDGDR